MKCSIFLVEKNQKQLHEMQREFSSMGEFAFVGMTSDGEDCIQQLEGKQIDVLVLDMILPRKDGFYVLEQIRRKKLKVNHIICTTTYLSEIIVS